MNPSIFDSYLSQFDHQLKGYLAQINADQNLVDAMIYSTLNGGKRLRPLLVIAGGELSLADNKTLLSIGIAIEMVHSYSLVHDDLPAMDNDDFRRGKPSCHKAFGEATAILAGDALLTESFLALSHIKNISHNTLIQLIQRLALASGASGMIQGQFLDMHAENREISLNELKEIHLYKTGALISASIVMGYLSGSKVDLSELEAIEKFSKLLGLAFQVKDDILDATSDSKTLGKTAGKDEIQNKATYISLLGIEKASLFLDSLIEEALQILVPFNQRAKLLSELTHFVAQRNH